MKKRRILWFSNAQFSEEEIRTTGTWIIAMGKAISEVHDIELYNVTAGDVKSVTSKSCGKITQWVVPNRERNKYHKGSSEFISFIKKIGEEIKPDLIHLWGTENGFGFAIIEADLGIPVLLEMQGLLLSIGGNYYGGLSLRDLIKSHGLKEILKPELSSYLVRRKFEKRGRHEKRLIRQMRYISVQSDWVNSYIRLISPDSHIFRSGMMLRNAFYESPAWQYRGGRETIDIFTSSSGAIPYKGLHVVFDAVAVLKARYPNIRLRIGGKIETKKKYGVIRDGYTSWLMNKASKLGIAGSISWLGMMSADEMSREMRKSDVAVVPSYIESYCLFLAEAMMVGVPVVASYAGAMPELAEHGKSALFFPVGDYMSCASQIERIITNRKLAEDLSAESRRVAFQRNDPDKVWQKQVDIYKQVIDNAL